MHAFLKKARLELTDRSKAWVDSYVLRVTDRKKQADLTLKLKYSGYPKANVDVDNSGRLYASFKCIECQKDVRIAMKRCRTGSNSVGSYFRQNFDKHMLRVHLNIEEYSVRGSKTGC